MTTPREEFTGVQSQPFREQFERALIDERFQGLDDENKRHFLNRLMDSDKRMSQLDQPNRQQYFKRAMDYYQQQYEEFQTEEAKPYSQKLVESEIGQATGIDKVVNPEGITGKTLDFGAGIPFMGPLTTEFGKGVLSAANAGLAGMEEVGHAINELAGRGHLRESTGASLMERVTKRNQELIAGLPTQDGVNTSKDIKLFEQGGFRRAADWFGGGLGQTLGYVAPAAVFSLVTGGTSTLVPFSLILTGEQVGEVREETGGDPGSALVNIMSGTAQAAIERLAGPESLVGRNIFRDGVRKAISGSMKKFGVRLAGGATGEALTEGFQEYMNQQVGEWTAGDRGWWNNLEAEDKLAVGEGVLLGGAVGGLFSGFHAIGQTVIGDRRNALTEFVIALQGMTPEERGAIGVIETPRAVRPLTEQEENDLRSDLAPRFLGETGTNIDKFVDGTLDTTQFTEEQQAEIAAARAEIDERLKLPEDPNVAPVPRGSETRTEQAGLDEVVALASVKQQNLIDEGDTEGAAQIQEAIDTLEIVRPKSAAMASLKGFAEKHGAKINFFRATNSELLGSNGVSIDTNSGEIFVRWDATVPQTVAAIALHEIVHVIGRTNVEAMTALYNTVKTYDPKWMAETESWLRTKYAENGLTLSEEDMMHETVAYMAQSRAHEVFAALRMAARDYKFTDKVGPIKKMIDRMKDVVRKAMRALPKHEAIFGPVLNEEFDAKNRRAHEQMLGQFAKFLKLGEAGRKPLDIQPDNFGRRGRKTLTTEVAPAPAPRRPGILEDATQPRTPRILEDTGKRAGKRELLYKKEPGPVQDTGFNQTVFFDEKMPKVAKKQPSRMAEQEELPLKTPPKPAEVELGKKPVEAVKTPRTPRILLDEPITRTTAARLEVGDQLEVDNELVSVTKSEPKGNKRVLHYVDQDGDVSVVTVAPNKRFMRFDQKPVPPSEEGEAMSPKQGTLFSLESNVAAMEKEEATVEDVKFSLVIDELVSGEKMLSGLSSENKEKMLTIFDEAGVWGLTFSNIRTVILSDESGPRGFAHVRERYRDSYDREVYVEWIESTYDSKGDRVYDDQGKYNTLGVRNVMAGRKELAKLFPKAIWVGGFRVGGARAESEAWRLRIPGFEYTRIPMYDKQTRNSGEGLPKWWKEEMISEGVLSQDILDKRHEFDPEGRPVKSEDEGMRQDRTAPLDRPILYSFSDSPGHFPPGHVSQTPLYNLNQVGPLSGLDPDSGPSWGLPDTSWKARMITKFQDRFYRVKELQKEIERMHGSIHEDMDPYLYEMLYHGTAADRVGVFEKEFVDPLVDFIREKDVDIPEFEEWLHARHTEERNAHLDEIWEHRKRENLLKQIGEIENEIEYNESRDVDTAVLKRRVYRRKKELAALKTNIHHAGMSNEAAASILEAAGTKFDAVAEIFDNMMDQKLKILFDAGMITQAQLDKVNIYKHYVPLKGKEYKGDLEDILEDQGIHTGQGFDIRGDEIGFSFGRVGDNQHTQPILAQAVVDIEEAIVRAEKNEVGKAFLGLVREFPNPKLYKVNSVTRRRVWDAKTGTVRLVKDAFANRADNVIAVKEGGKTHYIEIFDARLASSMKNLGSEPMSQAVKLAALFNRFMAAVNTTYNPEFILTNPIRDVLAAGFNLSTEELKHLQIETMKNIPLAINGIRKAEGLTTQDEAQVSQDEWVKYYREYVEDGGKIGFFGYTDVHEKAKAIERKIRHASKTPKNMAFSTAQKIGDFVSSANSVMENATRLSAYVAARSQGVSRKKAAALGRNLTVNFNKKGDAGQTMNAIWLFSNASIQGAFRMLTALKSERVQKMVGAQIVASFGMAAMNRALGGEDEEDGTPYWEKLGDWQKERNFIFMLDKGKHIKIPLPYGYNVFHVIGTELEAIAHATATGTMTPERAVRAGANLFNAVMTAFNPLGSASLDTKWQSFRFAVPSAFAPLADTLVNESYYGSPIRPVKSSWDYSPDSQRYWKRGGDKNLTQELMTYLNRWTGGSEYESGWLDLNPENLDYLVGAYTGSAAKTAVRGFVDAKWMWDAMNSKDTSKYEANDIVFLRRIYGEINDNTVASVFYENIEGLSQGEKAFKNLKGEPLRDWKDDNKWMIPLFKKLSDAQKGIRDTEDADAKNRIRKGFNKSYREAWLSQF